MSRPDPPAPLLPPPAGYTFGKSLPSAVVAHAREVLNDSSFQYGDTDTQTVNGVDYIHRVEPHYDDHAGGGLRWHRGVTVYQPVGLSGGGGAGGGGSAPPAGGGGQRGAPPAPPPADVVVDDGGEEQPAQPKVLYFLVSAAVGFFFARQAMAMMGGAR